ncbi:MAG: preprotein translocase subunit SecG [Planctomycetaceae bacterium]|nr:preprotein translocase subunit SecG [Planctomycetaceae bacterium]
MATFVSTLLMLAGIFMILLILVQRGRGGGLAGAFGGMGGQSAFGTKAGDVFTKITVGVAVVWVVLAGASIRLMDNAASGNYQGGEEAGATVPTAEAGASSEEEGAGAGGLDSVLPPTKESKAPGESGTESGESAEKAPAEEKTDE